MASWNVENLFDAEDDPNNTGDDPFTPGGWQHWSERRYQKKLSNLADALTAIDADIVCLQEVENRRVLDDLTHVLRDDYGRDYPYIVHREGTDHRGIDNAILSRFPPADTRWITPVEEQRDIVIARFDSPAGAPLHLFVNHWKSRWGPREAADRMRMTQARAVRKEVQALLAADPDAAILLAGDFNDDFDGPAIVKELGASSGTDPAGSKPALIPMVGLHGALDAELRGSLYYRRGKVWNSFDQMIASRSMLDAKTSRTGWRVKKNSFEVVHLPMHVDADGLPKPFRYLKNKASGRKEFMEGYSDHFPIRVTLEVEPTPRSADPSQEGT